MARLEYKGFEILQNRIAQLERSTIRRLVEAGANALIESSREDTIAAGHVGESRTMKDSFKPGKFHETLGGGWMDVYPQGNDPRGVSQTKKAYVINYGYGGRKTQKTGDKFITGSGKRKRASAINLAMEMENEKIIKEANGGT